MFEDVAMVWSTESRQSRGYGKEWTKLRKAAMQRDCGLCQVCAKAGRVTLAQAVDHIKPKAKGGADAMDNVQAICDPCHAIKTAADSGHTLRLKQRIGLDGWPL